MIVIESITTLDVPDNIWQIAARNIPETRCFYGDQVTYKDTVKTLELIRG